MTRRGRRYSREFLLQVLFEAASRRLNRLELLKLRGEEQDMEQEDMDYAQRVCAAVSEGNARIDERIAVAAPQWPLHQVSKVDLFDHADGHGRDDARKRADGGHNRRSGQAGEALWWREFGFIRERRSGIDREIHGGAGRRGGSRAGVRLNWRKPR